MKDRNILNENQYSFRKSRGTTIAVAYEQIANALAGQQQCNIILRDVSKAFDKVWHDGLRHRLIDIQLPDIITKTLNSFLNGRSAQG